MKYILGIIIVLLFTFLPSFALESSVQDKYHDFIVKIEKKYSNTTQDKILRSFREKIYEYSLKDHSQKKQGYIQEMIAFNNEAIYNLERNISLDKNSQKVKEERIKSELQKNNNQLFISPDVLTLLKNQNITLIRINSSDEFLENNEIFKIEYTKYFQIESSIVSQLLSKSGIIIGDDTGGFRFIENYSKKKKIPYSQLSEEFVGVLNPQYKTIVKNGYYYGYIFDTYVYYKDEYGVYESQLEKSQLEKKKDFLYIDEEGKYNFIKKFTERKLLPEQELFGISEKGLFLKYLLSDGEHISSDIEKNMQKIKNISKNITQGRKQEDKTRIIYEWILENIEYTKVVNLNDSQIFSAGEAINSGEGVCTAYAKLMVFMMLYSGFYDVRMIEGHVIDAQDFPRIGHAWVQHKDKFYDPTFDDPVGGISTKKFEEYKYYDMPRDIFYANRFLYNDLPKTFESGTKEQIRQYIFNYLSNLIPKYQGQLGKYEVFNEVVFRRNNKLSANTIITPELLGKKLGYFEVDGETFQFEKDGKRQQITNLLYFKIDENNTESILTQLNYHVEDIYLFKWNNKGGSYDWKIAYNVEIR